MLQHIQWFYTSAGREEKKETQNEMTQNWAFCKTCLTWSFWRYFSPLIERQHAKKDYFTSLWLRLGLQIGFLYNDALYWTKMWHTLWYYFRDFRLHFRPRQMIDMFCHVSFFLIIGFVCVSIKGCLLHYDAAAELLWQLLLAVAVCLNQWP